jgi:CRISPR-associated endoribonuclease Cas6
MRFLLQLAIDKAFGGNTLPINYQYEMSSFVYAAIHRSNAQYSTWLHQNGFIADNKQFRLFTFSHLHVPQYKINGDRLIIESPTVEWQIAFLPERSTEEFIRGLFSEQVFTLGDRKSKVQFRVTSIELIPDPVFTPDTVFATLSPVCIARHIPDTNQIFYESPDSIYAREAMLRNLKNKYAAYHGTHYTSSDTFELKLLSKPISKLVTIKTGTPYQTKIRGYTFRFKLKADEELMKVMWNSGLGEKGSMGFGCVGKG